jgi:hypothetical protein
MTFQFKKATKKDQKLRLGLVGPSGSGKTYSALAIATGLGARIAVVDSEHGSASLYSDRFTFDVIELVSFSPENYIGAIHAAEEAGYDVVILDSLSHAWAGKDGILEQKDAAAKRNKGDSFGAWRDLTPLHNKLIDTIVGSSIHVIATMRAKQEYVVQKDEKTGKTSVKKLGLAPVQRDGMEYEFTLVGDMDDSDLVVTKSRVEALSGKVIQKPGKEMGKQLRAWLSDGVAPPVTRPAAAPEAAPAASPAVAPVETGTDEEALLLKQFSEASTHDDLKRIGASGKPAMARMEARRPGAAARVRAAYEKNWTEISNGPHADEEPPVAAPPPPPAPATAPKRSVVDLDSLPA